MAIVGVISFIAGLAISGYGVSLIKSGIEKSPDVPGIDFTNNVIDGVKVLVINAIYLVIPLAIVIILAALSTMGLLVDKQVFFGLGLTVIVAAVILYLLFGLMDYVAIARFANTREFSDAIAIKEVFRDIKRIGIFKVIGFVILLFVLILVIAMILGLIGFIPYVGSVISSFVGGSYLIFFANRALGLLYGDSE